MSRLTTLLRRGLLAFATVLALPTVALAAKPVIIGVIAPASAIDGRSIFQGAELAAADINAAGGINGRKIVLKKFDDHFSASNGVRAFQRAVQQDHAVAVVGTFASEVSLAVEPWAVRLKTPFIVTGGASTKITELVHHHWPAYRYVFEEVINSYYAARQVCQYSHDILVKGLGYKTAVVMSEDADWTKPLDQEYLKCLPKAGLKVLDHIRFDPSTSDFTPIFDRIQKDNPDVIITGIAHVGAKPTIQWHQRQVPMLMAGISSQAMSGSFWADTNGAANGVITQNYGSANAALTPTTESFSRRYFKKYGETPTYNAYTTYDSLHVIKAAIERAGSTKANALAAALGKTNYVGTIGRVQFYGPHAKYTHAMKYGKKYVPGIATQWQNGKEVVVWPESVATGKVMTLSYMKH